MIKVCGRCDKLRRLVPAGRLIRQAKRVCGQCDMAENTNSQDTIGRTINVLDQGWVIFADVMGSDTLIVESARTTRRGLSNEDTGIEAQRRILRRLLLNLPPHTSPFERAEVVFHVRIPGLALWHWKRHRTFRWWDLSVQSGRTSEYQAEDFYYPTKWRTENPRRDSVYETGNLTNRLERQYKTGYDNYRYALSLGIAKEQARLFLNNFAVYIELEAKCDLHNFMHFLRLRLDRKAQWEIRQYAEAMYCLFAEAFPLTRQAFDVQVARDQGEG